MKKLVTLNLMGSSNGRRVSVKYKKGAKERMVHFWPEKQEKWKLSSGYVPHHMKNLKRACKLFLEAYAFPLFERGGPGVFDTPSSTEWSDLFQDDQTKPKTMQRLLKILYIGDVEVAKNGRKYRTVKFEADTRMPDGTPVFTNLTEGTRTIWDHFVDKEGNEFKADGLWSAIESGAAKAGSYVEGQVTRVSTYPYKPEGFTNEAKTWTGVVFGHEDPTDYINKQLKKNFSCVMYGDNLTAPDQINRPATPATGAPTTIPTGVGSAL